MGWCASARCAGCRKRLAAKPPRRHRPRTGVRGAGLPCKGGRKSPRREPRLQPKRSCPYTSGSGPEPSPRQRSLCCVFGSRAWFPDVFRISWSLKTFSSSLVPSNFSGLAIFSARSLVVGVSAPSGWRASRLVYSVNGIVGVGTGGLDCRASIVEELAELLHPLLEQGIFHLPFDLPL